MGISDIITFISDETELIECLKNNESVTFQDGTLKVNDLMRVFTDNGLFNYTGTILIKAPVMPIEWALTFDTLNKKIKYPLQFGFYDLTTTQKYFFFENRIPVLTSMNILENRNILLENALGIWLSFFDQPKASEIFELEKQTYSPPVAHPIFLDSPEIFNPEIDEVELIKFIDSILEKALDWRIITNKVKLWQERSGY